MVLRVFLLFVIVLFVDSWRPFRILIYDPSYTVHFPNIVDYNLTIVNNDTINTYFNVFENLPNPFFHMEYIVDSGNEKYDMVFANLTYAACTFFENRKLDVILQLFFKIAEKFGEIPKRCPLQKKLYYIKNMKIDSEYLPPVLPEKKGYVVFSFLTKKQDKFITLISGKAFFKIEASFKNSKI